MEEYLYNKIEELEELLYIDKLSTYGGGLLDAYKDVKNQFATSGVSKSFTAKQVADMLVKDFSTIEEAIAYFDKHK